MTFGRAALILSVALALGACSRGVLDEHPQVTHCKTALGFLVSPEDNVQLMASERTLDGSAATVSLDLRVNNRPQSMTCRYGGTGSRETRRPRASSIEIGGEPISDADREAVNDAVFENRDPLRNLRRSIRTG